MDIKPKSFQNSKPPENHSADKQLRDVAALYEKQFLREMVKQMRATVGESEFMPAGFAEKFYREQLDQQYVEQWGDKGGIGLGKMIYDQLLDRYGERMGIRLPQQKVQGPIPLSQKDQWSGSVRENERAIQFQRRADTKAAPVSLQSPWDGEWLGSFPLEGGLQAAKIKHDGVESIFVGNFQVTAKTIGEKVRAGEGIATLAPEANKWSWRIVGADPSKKTEVK